MRSKKSAALRSCAARTRASRVSLAGSSCRRQPKTPEATTTTAKRRRHLEALTDFTSTFSRVFNRRERIRAVKRARAAAVLILAFLLCAAGLRAAEKPSLVVVISVDQMRADYLERFRPYFGKDGFNRFLERGAWFTQARHRHAITYTGPGHAVIGTGLDPRDTGIIANRWYDIARSRPVYCAEDRGASWVGQPAGGDSGPILPASPAQMDGPNLGDRVKEKYPKARVVAVALKDRAAALMAGRKADAAIWFEERFDRFVTSSFYPPQPELLAVDAELPAFFAAPEHKVWNLSGKIPAADLD